MNRKLNYSVIIFGLTALLTQAGPHMEFASTTNDFGRVKSGETVKCTFVFTNTGNETLRITGIYPGCGCTVAKGYTENVDPGKTGDVSFEFTPTGEGPVEKLVGIAHNGPETPYILRLKATAWLALRWFPDNFTLMLSAHADSSSVTNRIINYAPEPMVLSLGEWKRKDLRFALHEVRPGKEWEVVASMDRAELTNDLYDVVKIGTTLPGLPMVSHAITIRMLPDVQLFPTWLAWEPKSLDTGTNFTFRIVNYAPEPLCLAGPFVNDKDVLVQLQERKSGREFVGSVIVPPRREISRVGPVTISFRTDKKRSPLIETKVIRLPEN